MLATPRRAVRRFLKGTKVQAKLRDEIEKLTEGAPALETWAYTDSCTPCVQCLSFHLVSESVRCGEEPLFC
jgi:hypothetical protein